MQSHTICPGLHLPLIKIILIIIIITLLKRCWINCINFDHLGGCSLRCCWTALCYVAVARCSYYFAHPIQINRYVLFTVHCSPAQHYKLQSPKIMIMKLNKHLFKKKKLYITFMKENLLQDCCFRFSKVFLINWLMRLYQKIKIKSLHITLSLQAGPSLKCTASPCCLKNVSKLNFGLIISSKLFTQVLKI